MFQFNGEKGKRAKVVLSIITIVIVIAMILGVIVSALL